MMNNGKSMIYKLYPPFLNIPEEYDFAGAWESFCCKMLNLAQNTSNVIRRKHPDYGIDLYDQEKEFAYQCKSVESGKSSDFHVENSLASIKRTKEARHAGIVRWKKYYLCTNVTLSGNAEKKLREELPEIEFLPESHWQQQCEKHPDYVRRFFHVLSPVSKYLINKQFLSPMKVLLKKELLGMKVPCIGRENIVNNLIRDLNDYRKHVLLVHGLPGVGKTRIVIELHEKTSSHEWKVVEPVIRTSKELNLLEKELKDFWSENHSDDKNKLRVLCPVSRSYRKC